MRRRVEAAREIQARRYAGRGWQLNSAVPGPVLAREWPLDPAAQRLVDDALSKGEITRRGMTRVHRLAWTVADCDGIERPGVQEVETALALRATGAGRPLPARILRRVS
jgi:magnesium chelatase family protein